MSLCARCGATFSCAMADPDPAASTVPAPCWCTYLPAAMPVPDNDASAEKIGCWCPACLQQHIQLLKKPR